MIATPRSRDRGPIEASIAVDAVGTLPVLTPRSRDRGPIEAAIWPTIAHTIAVATPRSRDRGPIEAIEAGDGAAIGVHSAVT